MAIKSQNDDPPRKILLIGNSGVGKSNLFLRFSDNKFEQRFLPTLGIDFKLKTLNLNKTILKLQIWDTSGQERFRTITSTYYKCANGIIFVYDINNRQSFKDIENWVIEAEKLSNGNVVRLLVGNKSEDQNWLKNQVYNFQKLALKIILMLNKYLLQ